MALTRCRPGPYRFEFTYEDDILGTLHAHSESTRDRDGKLRRRDDLGAPDRDHLLEGWTPPVERDPDPL